MRNPILMDSYDEIPYESTPITETDPDRLAVIGRLFGLEAADPYGCRVLELGCAAGGNLIPLAWRYPESRFVGIELSSRQVKDGQRLIERLGLNNIELIEGDILKFGKEGAPDPFDYILCHGVWSWVPDQVRDHIFDICTRFLAPTGIAYISYNTLPGWRLKGVLRDMLLYHTSQTASPPERLAEAEQFLEFILSATKDLDPLYVKQLKQQVDRIRDTHPSYFFHEYLEQINEPALFSDFMARAETKGLNYLADTELHTMFPTTLGDEVEAALGDMDDAIRQEQYMDFIRNRAFRQTLLCHAETLTDRVLDLERFEDFFFFADLVPPNKLDLRRPKAQKYRNPAGEDVAVKHPLTKAAVAELARRYPDSVSFSELSDHARMAVSQAGGGAHAEAPEHFFGEIFSLFLNQSIGASLSEAAFPRFSDPPKLNELATAQAAEKLGHLSTARHTTLTLDPLAQRLAELLDGRRDIKRLAEELGGIIQAAPEEYPGWSTEKINVDKANSKLKANVDRLAHLFARQGVLTDG